MKRRRFDSCLATCKHIWTNFKPGTAKLIRYSEKNPQRKNTEHTYQKQNCKINRGYTNQFCGEVFADPVEWGVVVAGPAPALPSGGGYAEAGG